MNENNFQKAIDCINYRQRFLELVDLEDAAPYIHEVKYNPEQPIHIFKIMHIIPARRKKSDIEVFPFAFDREINPTYQDFLSCLIDHEGSHAKQNHFQKRSSVFENFFQNFMDRALLGPTLYPRKQNAQRTILDSKKEIMAYSVQLSRADKRGVSEQYKERIKINKHFYELSIKHSLPLLSQKSGLVSFIESAVNDRCFAMLKQRLPE